MYTLMTDVRAIAPLIMFLSFALIGCKARNAANSTAESSPHVCGDRVVVRYETYEVYFDLPQRCGGLRMDNGANFTFTLSPESLELGYIGNNAPTGSTIRAAMFLLKWLGSDERLRLVAKIRNGESSEVLTEKERKKFGRLIDGEVVETMPRVTLRTDRE